jgi:oxaloacetate decarboxylase alpha subunit/pyruvate carboxylase subunit B
MPPMQQMPMMPSMPAAAPARAAAPAAAPAAPAAKAEPAKEEAAPAPAAADVEGTPLTAPMPGMIVNYQKKVGDEVSEGETVVILEAMKMENALPSPASGTVKAINFSSGDSVQKNDVLAIIG